MRWIKAYDRILHALKGVSKRGTDVWWNGGTLYESCVTGYNGWIRHPCIVHFASYRIMLRKGKSRA